MTWNNRVLRKAKRNPSKGGKPEILHFYDVHEVYYDKKGNPNGWTEEPIIGGFESIQDLQSSLAQMLGDVIEHPILEIRGKRNPRLVERTPKDGEGR